MVIFVCLLLFGLVCLGLGFWWFVWLVWVFNCGCCVFYGLGCGLLVVCVLVICLSVSL